MSFEPREYLQHIRDETEFLLGHSRNVSQEAFESDPVLQRAFIRSLEIIGEAVKKLPPEFITEHPEINWRGIAGMRDRLIHGYFAVDLALVWEVLQEKISPLHATVDRILSNAT